jgi:hypothetical protein
MNVRPDQIIVHFSDVCPQCAKKHNLSTKNTRVKRALPKVMTDGPPPCSLCEEYAALSADCEVIEVEQ